jgi:hypothetical protein
MTTGLKRFEHQYKIFTLERMAKIFINLKFHTLYLLEMDLTTPKFPS